MKRVNLELVLKGLDLVRDAIVNEITEGSVTPVEEVVNNVADIKEKINATVEEIPEVVEEEVVEEGSIELDKNTEYLNGLTLKELKELAKELKVSTKGSKSAIIGRIMEAQDHLEVEEEDVDPITDAEVEELLEQPSVQNPLEEQLNEMTVEELADILAEIGVSTKGKKQSLVAKVLKAVEEGKIEFSDDEEEEEEVETNDEIVETDDEVVEPSDEIEEVEEDEEGIDLSEILEELGTKEIKDLAKALGLKVTLKDKKPSLVEKIENMEDTDLLMTTLLEQGIIEADVEEATEEIEEEVATDEFEVVGSEARIEAVENKFADLMEQVENGEVTVEEIKEFFNEYWADNKSELKKIENMNDDDLANNYCWVQANLIDDEGEEVDFQEPYMVGETPYCCGRPMKKLNETTYVCEIDGDEVEIEE